MEQRRYKRFTQKKGKSNKGRGNFQNNGSKNCFYFRSYNHINKLYGEEKILFKPVVKRTL